MSKYDGLVNLVLALIVGTVVVAASAYVLSSAVHVSGSNKPAHRTITAMSSPTVLSEFQDLSRIAANGLEAGR